MKLLPLFFLSGIVLFGQQQTGPATARGTCSPANTGNNNTFTITCAALTPAQQKLVEGIPALLNKLLDAQQKETAEILTGVDVCIDSASAAGRAAAAATRGVTIIYNFDGSRVSKINRANSRTETVIGDPLPAFSVMQTLAAQAKWAELNTLAEEQIKQYPEWLTSRLYQAFAQDGLGNRERAVALLRYVRNQSGGDPEYAQAEELLKRLGVQ